MVERVVIVGAGILGAMAAYRLARAGYAVTVLDAATPGGVATAATFGWINASFYLDDAHHRLRVEAIAAWHRLQAELTGLPVAWPGCLWWEESGADFDAMEARLTALGYPLERWNSDQVSKAVPGLGEVPEAALHFPGEGVAEGTGTARYVLHAAADLGARIIGGTAVRSVETDNGRVTSLRLAGGTIPADHVLIAAGRGSAALLSPFGIDMGLLPRPAVTLRTNPVAAVMDRLIVPPGMEIRQDAEGRIVAPTSPKHQEDATEELPETPDKLADATMVRLKRMFPGLDLRWEDALLGWRPMPQDGFPAVGPAGPDGLYVAVMHSGMTLAALMGELVAAEIGGKMSDWLQPYRLERFVT
ncbi:FAD-binding oxidoreductase [Pseudoruegeria sp. HB172150]|uniref:NAD(P)/FAD-dependent oxidoreductase n=1 Tax=Pseudoruegeria sp. HB172150 TaxID=2721164 RepID=UPI001552098A|nr:FAD-dependent oxidoreductase [Pseudoruegeria sp. HB172150]